MQKIKEFFKVKVWPWFKYVLAAIVGALIAIVVGEATKKEQEELVVDQSKIDEVQKDFLLYIGNSLMNQKEVVFDFPNGTSEHPGESFTFECKLVEKPDWLGNEGMIKNW